MTTTIPARLRSVDVSRFALRAAQLEKAKPIISYWCNYWIVNQIVSSGLHNADAECNAFTAALMDKLEQMKSENIDNDAITDPTAAQAYVEQFGLEVFQRADNAVRVNKVTRQTADTFQAAATLLDLLHIWGIIDSEIISKTKYAKYHALRIAKAIRAGEDPNATNPQIETFPDQEGDPDAEFLARQTVHDTSFEDRLQNIRQAFVEDMSEESNRQEEHAAIPYIPGKESDPSGPFPGPHQPNLDTSRPILTPPPPHLDEKAFYNNIKMNNDVVSPVEDLRAGSTVDTHMHDSPMFGSSSDNTVLPLKRPHEPTAPDASPAKAYNRLPDASYPGVHLDRLEGRAPQNFPASGLEPHYSPDSRPPRSFTDTTPQTAPSVIRPSAPPDDYYSVQTANEPRSTAPQPGETEVDEEAIKQATKHARWAISALNFEDVKTAVKELRGALESLGVRE